MGRNQRVMVTGGGGYVGSALVPYLLSKNYDVKVIDLFIYGEDVFNDVKDHPGLSLIKADIRDQKTIKESIKGCDAVIHLACISNDSSFELDPSLSKSINLDAFMPLMDMSMEQGIKRFIYASSSSIYGIKETTDVREDAEPRPLTDYSKFKLECEHILLEKGKQTGMTCAIVRPATVCGYAPRQRLDLTVNILTIHALVNKNIRIFGGKQLRPNLNIQDMVRIYDLYLNAPHEAIHCIPYNAGFQNRSVADIAELVKQTLGDESIKIEVVPTDDLRSYHINSDLICDRLGFEAQFTIEDAIQSLTDAVRSDKLKDPVHNSIYYNVRKMQEIEMK